MTPVDQARASGDLPVHTRISASIVEKCELIEATNWGIDFSYEQLKHLAGFMGLHKIRAGMELFAEGDRDPYFLLIVEGRIDVIKSDAGDQRKRINTLGAGKTIGEMNLVDGEPRSASAVAATDATVLIMTGDNFAELRQAFPRVALVLLTKIAKQMSQFLRLTSGRLIDYLGD